MPAAVRCADTCTNRCVTSPLTSSGTKERDILKGLVAQPAAHRGNLLVIEPPARLALPLVPTDTPHPPTAPPLLIYAELRLRATDQANEAAEMLLPELMVRGDH